jgi:hypothetical protein
MDIDLDSHGRIMQALLACCQRAQRYLSKATENPASSKNLDP